MSRAMMRLPASSSVQLPIIARRQFTLVTGSRAKPSLRGNTEVKQSFRRAYADSAPVKTPRRMRFFKWIWRATYLSALGGVGYIAYGVWEQKNPDDQFIPDSNKKNLVILGKCLCNSSLY